MQSFVIFWRSSSVYRAGAGTGTEVVGAGTGTEVVGAGAFGGPMLLDAGVFFLGLAGCSSLLELTMLGETFL